MNSSRKSLAFFLTAAGLTLTAAPAYSQGSGVRPPPREREETAATGKTSGAGTIKEINAQQFEAIDRDNDDHINLTEFTSSPILGAGNEVSPGQSATVAAPRSDGTVLIKPAPGRNTPELFRRLDKDRDGFLDSVEIAAFYLSELEN